MEQPDAMILLNMANSIGEQEVNEEGSVRASKEDCTLEREGGGFEGNCEGRSAGPLSGPLSDIGLEASAIVILL